MQGVLIMKKQDALKLLEKVYEKYPPRKSVGFGITAKKTGLFDCKIGGVPYFPKDMEYPSARSEANKGKPMRLLVQLNFEKIPHIEDFPDKGILQIFIAPDDLYGMNFDDYTKQDDFRVIYHENIITDESALINEDDLPDFTVDDDLLPFSGDDDYLLEPTAPADIFPDFSDHRFDELFLEIYHAGGGTGNDAYDIVIDDEDDLTMCDLAALAAENKAAFIGGFPVFTQEDPRTYKEDIADCDTVLFESISVSDLYDKGVYIMWGDSGTGAFLIPREALKNRDFSKVAYNYDCY